MSKNKQNQNKNPQNQNNLSNNVNECPNTSIKQEKDNSLNNCNNPGKASYISANEIKGRHVLYAQCGRTEHVGF